MTKTQEAAADAAKVIANAAAEATKVIANAAAAATSKNEDHDILIELRTELKGLKEDVKEIKDGFAIQINDHENRIRSVEGKVTKIMTWGTAAMLIIGIAQFLINKFL